MGFRSSFRLGKGCRMSFGPKSASLSFGGVRIGTRSSSVKIGGMTFSSSGSSARSSTGTSYSGRDMDVRLAVGDDGKLIIEDLQGNSLPENLVRKIKRDYSEQIKQLYSQAHAKMVEKTDDILNIHKDLYREKTQNDWQNDLSAKKYIQPLAEGDFNKPIPLTKERIFEENYQKEKKNLDAISCLTVLVIIGIGFFSFNGMLNKIVESSLSQELVVLIIIGLFLLIPLSIWLINLIINNIAHMRALKPSEIQHNRLLEEQESKQQEREKIFEENRQRFMEEEQKRIETVKKLLEGDPDTVKTELSKTLEEVAFPLETSVDFQIGDTRTIMLDVDLPEIENIFGKKSNILASGKISVKQKSQKEIAQDYSKAVHGIILALAAIVFSTIPTCGMVIVSGYTQRINKKTGKEDDEYVISAIIDREKFYKLNIPKTDPILAMENFKHKRDISTSFLMNTIEPYQPEEIYVGAGGKEIPE